MHPIIWILIGFVCLLQMMAAFLAMAMDGKRAFRNRTDYLLWQFVPGNLIWVCFREIGDLIGRITKEVIDW